MKILASSIEYADDHFDELASHMELPHWHAVLSACATNSRPETSADLWKIITDKGLLKRVSDLIDHMTKTIKQTATELKMEALDIIAAFKTRPMFAFFRAVKFSVNLLIKPIKAFAELYRAGLMKVFVELHKSRAFQALNDGAIKLDEFLSRYPILKRLAGPAIAGLLIWMFLAGNFTFHPDMDMDLIGVVKAALFGDWSVAELFTSPQGLMALGLLITGLGALPWPSPAWLALATPKNILIALCYTSFKHLPQNTKIKTDVLRIKQHIKFNHF